MPLLSEMTKEELQAEMDRLREQGQVAFDEQRQTEYETLMQRWYLAKSYLIRDTFRPEIGRTYELEEELDSFTVTGQKGVMAWGIRFSTGLEGAVPIAMLKH
ncbi:MAG: YfhH family protein [Alicyclobacillus sp.]|nr:YfhH family protein [Alicyclobacillus sp.]